MSPEQQVFRWALGISAVAHLVAGGISSLPMFQPPRDAEPRKPMRLTYVQIPPAPAFATKGLLSAPDRNEAPAHEPSPRVARMPRLFGSAPSSAGVLPVPGESLSGPRRIDPMEPEQEEPVDLGVISATSPILTKEPAFQLYYRTIRASIRGKAYETVPRAVGQGEVYLSFVVNRNGGLESLTLDERRSTTNRTLREAALRAVREASPFPPFPPVVVQAHIAFTIAISFER